MSSADTWRNKLQHLERSAGTEAEGSIPGKAGTERAGNLAKEGLGEGAHPQYVFISGLCLGCALAALFSVSEL